MSEFSRILQVDSTVVTALQNVSFSIAKDETVALRGVNGAGKTTLTKILSTLLWNLPGRWF